MSVDLEALLARSEFFGHLDRDTLAVLATRCRFRELTRGQVLFHQGDEGDSVYVVVYGRLGVWQDTSGRLGEIGAGQCFGEMAVLRGETRSATVRADRDCRLLELRREDFLELLRSSPEAALKLALSNIERLADRQRQSGLPRAPQRSLAVVPLCRSLDAEAFCRQLAADLGQAESTRWLQAADLPEAVPDGPECVAWLNALESEHRLLYLADSDLTAWTRRCLRQADALLLIGSSQQPSMPPGEIEEFWCELGAGPTHLVLLHQHFPPSHSSSWLAGRAAQVHHCRPGHRGDLQRLARRLLGQARVLVLGGGGARGFAHLGVLRAFHELGIDIDACGGTSMGALMSALYALHATPEGVERDLRRIFLERGSLFDYGLPLVSLVRAERLAKALREVLGDLDLCDLPLPCFAVSADLSAARPRLHTCGPLRRAVAASMAIPGVVPPVVEAGHLLVDGAVLDNLPVSQARSLGWGKIVAVSVEVGTELLVEGQPYRRPLWTQLLEQLNPWRRRQRAPNLMHILVRSATLGRDRSQADAGQSADLLIHPDVSGYGMFDWHRLDQLAECGYRAAKSALEP